MHTVHFIQQQTSELSSSVQAALAQQFDVKIHKNWMSLPGKNNDPKLLLQPTTPVVVLYDEAEKDKLEGELEKLKVTGSEQNKRHPVLIIVDRDQIESAQKLIHAQDDFLTTAFTHAELLFKIEHLLSRNDAVKKLARDVKEASDIALLSMMHSSELGEISRFILESYNCNNYEELFVALFKTLESFMLQCSALVIVDDTVTLQSHNGICTEEIKEKLLKFHDTKRIISLGKEMIVSYKRTSIIVHNMPLDDEAKCGRVADNMAVLGNCFEARVEGIDAEQKAQAASRAKTMFLATMSHELRTPMNSVIGYTGRLIKKLEGRLSEREARQLDAIRRNGDHLLNLINDILDVSKIEVGKMEIHLEPINITTVLRNVYDQLLPIAANNQLLFKLQLGSENLTTQVDPKRFTQIIMNLVSNAIKYTKEGRVELSCRIFQDNTIGNAIAIAIKDTGIGISEENQAKLFDNFVQIDTALTRKVQGTGLGLAISAFFVQRHGGRIDIQSLEGEGSCFTVVIPCNPMPATQENITGNAV